MRLADDDSPSETVAGIAESMGLGAVGIRKLRFRQIEDYEPGGLGFYHPF